MAITGLWNEAVGIESGALKWGQGINPIHSIPGAAYGGRNYKPATVQNGPDGPSVNTLNPDLVDVGTTTDYGYVDEDFASSVWGYGNQTGTADRPGLGGATERFRGDTPRGWPSPGYKVAGIPGGNAYRAINKGGSLNENLKLGNKEETVGEGWVNKEVAGVADSTSSTYQQLIRQTSEMQRDQVRTGSQNPNTGTASEHTAPIGSFRPTWGMRVKPWSTGRRLYDMFPRQQTQVIRPFWYRNAGTGFPHWLEPNAQRMQEPLQRQPVPDPYAGNLIPDAGNVYQEESYPVQDYVNVWW